LWRKKAVREVVVSTIDRLDYLRPWSAVGTHG
jgi:hypothetical protein